MVGFFVLTCTLIQFVNAEFFTAIEDMEKLVHTESALIEHLRNYVSGEKERLNFLKNYLVDHQNRHKLASLDPTEYFSNPINAFLITKRLTSEWQDIENIIENDNIPNFFQNLTNHKANLWFPTAEDLSGAADALVRLQDLYKLNTTAIVKGEIHGVQYKSLMTASDCYQLGKQLYQSEDYEYAIQWFLEALNHLHPDDKENLRIRILQRLTNSYFRKGQGRIALQIKNELRTLEPSRVDFLKNKFFLKGRMNSAARHQTALEKNERSIEDVEVDIKLSDPLSFDIAQQNTYKKLCRKELEATPRQLAPLRCRYVTNKSAFLRLAPLKLEEACINPYIVIYHDVLYDAEIKVIKDLAKPKFKRAAVDVHGEGKVFPKFRISKAAWLRDKAHKYVKNVSKRVEDMTGLSLKTAERLQVVNYGIGGHYEPHFDFTISNDSATMDKDGNRIATVLFYMSDVIAGGATVFPLINVALWPEKGAASFWYNLYGTGKGDVRTKHAGCPVLIGSKWVCNKWLHESGQEFLRLCPLKPDHKDDIKY